MKSFFVTAFAATLLLSPLPSFAKEVGATTFAVSVTELREVAQGWSIKKVLGQKIYNDMGDSIGRVDDVIVAPDKSVSYAIISAGVYLHLVKHDVAVPVSYIEQRGDRFVLPGATKKALQDAPEFEYAH